MYLKQEMAVAKHVKQMQKTRNMRLRKKAMQALRTGAAAARLTKVNTVRQDARTSFHAFQVLKAYVLMQRRDRLLEERAEQFRRFNLKLRALAVLQKAIGLGPGAEGFQFYYSPSLCLSDSNLLDQNDTSFATQQGYRLARRHRLGFLFRWL